MALPSTYRTEPDDDPTLPAEPMLSGLLVVVVPSTELELYTEIQRTSELSGAPGSPATTMWDSVVVYGPQQTAGTPYFDKLPMTMNRSYYQARHVGGSYGAPSAWTPATTGHRPIWLPANHVPTMAPSQPWPFPKPWLPVSSGAVTRTLVLGPTAFRPATTADILNVAAGQLQNGTTGRANLRAAVFLPINSTPTAVRWTAFQSSGTTGGIGQANQFLFSVVTYPSSSGDYTVPRTFGIALTGGFGGVSSSGWTNGAGSVTLAYAALSTEVYVLEGTLGCTSMASGAMLNRIEVDYTFPAYYEQG